MTKKSTAAAETVPANPYPKTIDIIINGKPKTIKMSFGLQNTIASTMAGIEDAQMLIMDNERLLDVLNHVVADRGPEGQILEGSVDLRYGDALEMEDYEKLVEWTMGHIMHFFVRRARSLSLAGKAIRPELEALSKLTTG